jgi:hypothetical protein
MRPFITKIYFIVLFSSFITTRAQDSLSITNKHHFFISGQLGATFFGNFKLHGDVLPFASLYASYIPKNSKIMLSAGPCYLPYGLAYFGGGINTKIFLGKKVMKHNVVFEAGDRLVYCQTSYNYGSGIEEGKYSINNLYLGMGVLNFLSKEEKFFIALTGDICVNAYRSSSLNTMQKGPNSGLSSYSWTTIAPLILLQGGLRVR